MAPKKQKCGFCAKKQLISFQCAHCHLHFCMNHKMPECHHCAEDYTKKSPACMEKLTPLKIDKI